MVSFIPFQSIHSIPFHSIPFIPFHSIPFHSDPFRPGMGTTPAYQWKVNGNNVGTNSPAFTSSSLVNGDADNLCEWLPACLVVTADQLPASNAITISIIASNSHPIAPLQVLIPVCAASVLTFTSPVNGSVPSYQWKINGVNAGSNGAVFTTSSLTNGQSVTCVLTSNALCASPTTATSMLW